MVLRNYWIKASIFKQAGEPDISGLMSLKRFLYGSIPQDGLVACIISQVTFTKTFYFKTRDEGVAGIFGEVQL